MKTLLAFVGMSFGYVAFKFTAATVVTVNAADAHRVSELQAAQVAWAVVGFVLLFGMTSAFITEWVRRGEAE